MKKKTLVFVLLSTLFLTACISLKNREEVSEITQKQDSSKIQKNLKRKEGERQRTETERNKDKLTSEISKKKEEPEEAKKTEAEMKKLTEGWVTESKLSKGQSYHYPFLNETVFGEVAKKFNEETIALHKEAKHFYEEKDGDFFMGQVSYEVFLDSLTNTLSLLVKNISMHGDLLYRTFVVDLDTKKEVNLREALERTKLSLSDINGEVKGFYETLYAKASEYGLIEEEVDTELEDYVKERLYYFGKSLRTPVPEEVRPTLFTLNKGKLSLYLMVREAGSAYFYYSSYHLSKDLVERAVFNKGKDSLLARINVSGQDEMKAVKPIKEIRTTATGEKYYFIALSDGVKVKLMEVAYDEKADDFQKKAILYEGKLKKGEVIALDTVIPEGLPNLRLEAEANNLKYESELSYNGRFAPPLIEYLDGE